MEKRSTCSLNASSQCSWMHHQCFPAWKKTLRGRKSRFSHAVSKSGSKVHVMVAVCSPKYRDTTLILFLNETRSSVIFVVWVQFWWQCFFDLVRGSGAGYCASMLLDERWVTAYRIWCIFMMFYLLKYNIPKDPSPHGLLTKYLHYKMHPAKGGNSFWGERMQAADRRGLKVYMI